MASILNKIFHNLATLILKRGWSLTRAYRLVESVLDSDIFSPRRISAATGGKGVGVVRETLISSRENWRLQAAVNLYKISKLEEVILGCFANILALNSPVAQNIRQKGINGFFQRMIRR